MGTWPLDDAYDGDQRATDEDPHGCSIVSFVRYTPQYSLSLMNVTVRGVQVSG